MSTRTRGNACVPGNEEYWTKGGTGLEELDTEVPLEVNRRTYDGRRGGTTAGHEPGPSRHQPAGTGARKMARSHSTPAKRAITEQMSGSVEFDSTSVDTGLWRRWVSLLRWGSASLAVAKQ